jgi:hypothetical protein
VIKELINGNNSDEDIERTENTAWETFRWVVDNVLDKHKAPSYRQLSKCLNPTE